MKFEKGMEALLPATGRRCVVTKATEETYIEVEVIETGARLTIDGRKLRLIQAQEPENVSTFAPVNDHDIPPIFLRVTPTEQEANGKLYRRRVEWEDGELTELADEQMTSVGPKAKAVATKGNILCLTRDDVRWFYEQLGDLLRLWEREEEKVARR